MLFPAPEVSDVPAIAQLASPRLASGEDRVVRAEREQDSCAPVSLLGVGLSDFILDPVAGDRRFREHDQYLVPEPDGLVDRVEDLGADLHVLWREPAADALGLQVGVEPM